MLMLTLTTSPAHTELGTREKTAAKVARLAVRWAVVRGAPARCVVRRVERLCWSLCEKQASVLAGDGYTVGRTPVFQEMGSC